MFRGAAKVTLDDKGRMVFPTRYREHALERSQGKLVVTVDRDQCLLLYPLPDWEQIELKLMSLPSLHAQARRLQRLMVGHATELELDGHGRLLLPPELREFALLERQQHSAARQTPPGARPNREVATQVAAGVPLRFRVGRLRSPVTAIPEE